MRRRFDLGGQPLIEGANLRIGLRQAFEHAVEPVRQASDLVDVVDRQAAAEIAALDVTHRRRQRLQRPPMIRCVIKPETSVNPTTNTAAKMSEICSSFLSIAST